VVPFYVNIIDDAMPPQTLQSHQHKVANVLDFIMNSLGTVMSYTTNVLITYITSLNDLFG